MAAWILGLGVSAGYLISKNASMKQQLDESVKEFNQAAKPERGLQTETIREVQRAVPESDRYESLNMQDLGREDVQALTKMQSDQMNEVVTYENPSVLEIQGVYLISDNHGV